MELSAIMCSQYFLMFVKFLNINVFWYYALDHILNNFSCYGFEFQYFSYIEFYIIKYCFSKCSFNYLSTLLIIPN